MPLDNFKDVDLTTISLCSLPPPPPERRASVRQVTVLRAAKLYSAGGEELCLVRNISGGGLAAHVYTSRTVGERISAEFKSGQILPGCVTWRRDDLLGMRFDVPVDPAQILAEQIDYAAIALRSRGLRVAIDVPAHIRIGTDSWPASIRDISLGGAKVQARKWLEPGCPLVLAVGGMPPIDALIRWSDPEHTGLEFKIPLAFETLARWVATARSHHQPPARLALDAPAARARD